MRKFIEDHKDFKDHIDKIVNERKILEAKLSDQAYTPRWVMYKICKYLMINIDQLQDIFVF